MKTAKILVWMFILLIGCPRAAAYAAEPTGTLKGRLVDRDTRTPLPGANVIVAGTILGAATDEDGRFVIPEVPAGTYTLQFSYLGYEPLSQTDVIVRPGRITVVDGALKLSAVASAGVEVSGGYFSQSEDQPLGVAGFSHEEIRRAPGSAGDVSRILMGLPSLAKVNDQSNSLIVRGGSPLENGFFVDNIEIPNINHFPTQGSTGGPIGLLNVDLIQSVRFAAGGFPASFGDRLSAVMEIDFREGNRDEFDAQLDLNFAGFGAVAEGPLPGKKGAWLLSARRSYLDLLVRAIEIGTDIAPRYGDFQGKVVIDLSPAHSLTLLDIGGDDHSESDRETAEKNDMMVFGKQDYTEHTAGLNWRALWGGKGYSNTSLAHTANRWKEDFHETGSGRRIVRNRSVEMEVKLRNVNHFRISKNHAITFGIDAKILRSDFDNDYAGYTDALGNPVPAFRFSRRETVRKWGAFFTYTATPAARLTTSAGIRADYFSLTGNTSISPRLAVSYRLTDRTTLSSAAGLYRQSLPLLLLTQNPAHRQLNEPQAVHFLLGMTHLLTENTQLSLEIYQKDYRNFPLDPAQPGLFLIDELFYRYGFFFPHERLNDRGRAQSRGAELMVRKKLAEKIYGMASAAGFTARYRDDNGIWRHRVFDNRLIFSVEGGYKPNARWEFSLRWIYAGGAPYTPFDLAASQALNRAVLDEQRINRARYPAYHSLNLRFDRRFFFQRANLVAYLSVWNAYSRKNVAQYYWNQVKNQPGTIYQWTLLPIFGLEFEL